MPRTEMVSNNTNSEWISSCAAATQAITSARNVIHTYPHNSIRTESFATVANELRENSTLSVGSAKVLPLPFGLQMASNTPNEPQVSSSRSELNYSLSNARPPGTVNVNHGYEPDSPKDAKDVDPPSYEEAIKAMEQDKQNPPRCIFLIDNDHLQSRQYSNSQSEVQDQYFYPQPYQPYSSSEDIELRKKICIRMIFFVLFLSFVAMAIRIIFLMH